MGLKPLNGVYLTKEDNDEYGEMIAKKYNCSIDNVQTVTFVVTEACNLACEYCYQTNKTNRVMNKSTAKQAVDLLFNKEYINDYFDYDNSVAIILDFIGGEPLLEIELIDYIVDYFLFQCIQHNKIWGYNHRVSISTNGTLYSNSKVQDFLNKNNGRVSISVTVDGTKEMHDACRVDFNGCGSYDKASQALMDLRNKNVYQSTKVTICPENLNNLFASIVHIHEDIGLHFIPANCVFENVWSQADAQLFYIELIKIADYLLENKKYKNLYCSLFDESVGLPEHDNDQNWCGGNGRMLAFGVDGEIYPCQRYSACSMSSGRPPLTIGHVDTGIGMNGNEHCQICHLKKITLKSQSPQKCLDCKVASGCGLCSAFNYDVFGDANIRSTFICDMHHARVAANKYYWDKLKRNEVI